MSLRPVEAGAAAAAGAVWSFTVDIGPSFWPPQGDRPQGPVAGDLVILTVVKPAEVVAGPAGWTAGTGQVFYRMWMPGDSLLVTFHARAAAEWEVRGFIACPVSSGGTAVPWAGAPD